MISLFPELKEQFPRVAEQHPDWRPFIDCWEQISRLYNECVKWEALSAIEQSKAKRKKYFTVPNDCSRYLRGLYPQGSLNCWSSDTTYLHKKYSPSLA